MEFIIIVLISCAFWGFVCYKIAESRGRDKGLGILFGVLFGFFAFLGYLIAGSTDEKKAEVMANALKKSKK